MTYLIAAAGTGGHVFPGLSVAEALVDLGVSRSEVRFVGGSRLESEVYPAEGFPFLQVELRGLQRSLAAKNLGIPRIVIRARDRIRGEIDAAGIRCVLGLGGYVTIPAGWAARKAGVPFFNAEQNAEAGLANKVAARWARRTFTSFPETRGLPGGEWVGNPVRSPFWAFDRDALGRAARHHFDLPDGVPVLGVFGGSLGAGVLNQAVEAIAESGLGGEMAIVHVTGTAHIEALESKKPHHSVTWTRRGFEERMDLFYAAADLVLARAGGAVAELTATATPSILVPGSFGSARHQAENASYLARSGAGVIMQESDLPGLPELVGSLLHDESRLSEMQRSAAAISRPDAAHSIAKAMMSVT